MKPIQASEVRCSFEFIFAVIRPPLSAPCHGPWLVWMLGQLLQASWGGRHCAAGLRCQATAVAPPGDGSGRRKSAAAANTVQTAAPVRAVRCRTVSRVFSRRVNRSPFSARGSRLVCRLGRVRRLCRSSTPLTPTWPFTAGAEKPMLSAAPRLMPCLPLRLLTEGKLQECVNVLGVFRAATHSSPGVAWRLTAGGPICSRRGTPPCWRARRDGPRAAQTVLGRLLGAGCAV